MLLSEIEKDKWLGMRIKIVHTQNGYALTFMHGAIGKVIGIEDGMTPLIQFDEEFGHTKYRMGDVVYALGFEDALEFERTWFVKPEECLLEETNKPEWSRL